MKVGTDGTLLGAWARGGQTVLDIGTGTGLIALMMAQRFPQSQVTSIDIDAAAVEQARENVAASPFADRIAVLHADIRTANHTKDQALSVNNDTVGQPPCAKYDTVGQTPCAKYDAIVVNPPYFNDSLTCPDDQRTTARHTTTLTYRELMAAVGRLLADDGELSVVIPFDCKAQLESEASLAGLSKTRECSVRTTPRKAPRRYLLAFRKHPAELEVTEGVLETAPGERSVWYHELTKEFYL